MSEWKKVGVIGVDAGLCWVGDPCYILHQGEELPDFLGKNWSEFCEKLHKDSSGATQFGHSFGVAVSTGYGDGCYNVFVKHNSEGRIAEMKVVFIEEDADV